MSMKAKAIKETIIMTKENMKKKEVKIYAIAKF